MAKKSSAPKKTSAPKKEKPAPKKKLKEEEDEDEDEDLDLDAEDDEDEEEEEDLSTLKDDMLDDEGEDEKKRTPDEIELMLRDTECAFCPGSSSKLRCKVRTDYGCPPDKADK